MIIATMFVPNHVFSSTQKTISWLDQPITFFFQDKPLDKVLGQISALTGIIVTYDKKLANNRVSGNYKNVKASEAIARLFKGRNISIQVYEEEKAIIVKTFGAKNFISSYVNKGEDSSRLISLAELEELHSQQYKEYKDLIADDYEILDGNMTRREVRIMHRQQTQEMQQITNDPDYVDPLTGMTNSEIKALHIAQEMEFQQQHQNGDWIDPMTGVTQSEINALHEQQIQDFHSENTVDPFTEKTYEEIAELHNRQTRTIQ